MAKSRTIFELEWETEDSGPQNTIFGTRERAKDGAEKNWIEIESEPLAFYWQNNQLFADGIFTGYTITERIVH